MPLDPSTCFSNDYVRVMGFPNHTQKNNINDNPSPGMVLVLQLDGKGLQELVQIAVGIPQIVLVTSAFR